MTVSVVVRASTASRDAAVVVGVVGGGAEALSASEAWDLSKRLLNASLECERGERAKVAKAKAREVRRSSKVEEQLRDREV